MTLPDGRTIEPNGSYCPRHKWNSPPKKNNKNLNKPFRSGIILDPTGCALYFKQIGKKNGFFTEAFLLYYLLIINGGELCLKEMSLPKRERSI